MMRLLKNPTVHTVALLCMALILVVPYIAASLYAFPTSDDYAGAMEYQMYVQEHGPSPFNPVKAAVYKAVNDGLNFIVVFHYLLCPMLNGGIPVLRAWICASILLFIACMVYLAVTLCRSFWKGCTCRKVLFLTVLFLFFFYGLYNYAEVNLWYTCSISYELTVGAICLAGAFLLEYVRERGWLRLTLSVVCAAFASLSATNIGTLCCWVLLLIALWAFFMKKAKPVVWLPLFVAVAVTLVYLLLPGIWVRTDGATMNYGGALVYSVSVVAGRLGWFFGKTVFPAVLLAFAFFVWHNAPDNKQGRLWQLPALALLGAVISIVVTYPVALGYRQLNMPEHALYVTDTALFFSLLFLTAYVTMYLKTKPWLQRNQAVAGKGLALAACVWCAVSLAFFTSPLQYPFVGLSRELYSGKLAANRKVWEDQLATLADREGEQVGFYVDPDAVSQYVWYPALSWNPHYWTNMYFAMYYKLAYISCEYDYDFAVRLAIDAPEN